MTAFTALARAASVGALAVLCACNRAPHADAVPAEATVVALGDSLTYGTGATPETGYPAALATITGWNVVNAGVPGETAGQGCARLPTLLDEHRPHLVLVLLGGNDFLSRMPEHGIREALVHCVAAARNARALVVLLTVPRFGIAGLSNAPLYKEVGEALSVPVLESGLADLLARPALRADRVHLNAEGYRALASNIASGLRNAGLLAH